MNKNIYLNNLNKGDIVLIWYTNDINKMATVYNNLEDRILFKDVDGLFELTKDYIIRKDLKIETVE